jgi:hypothetical protein
LEDTTALVDYRQTPALPLSGGTCHVAVGFGDLSVLLEASICPGAPKLSTFVGVDRSAFGVARAYVLERLLQSSTTGSRIPTSSVLQVWFSTVWSEETMGYFQQACQGPPASRHQLSDEVRDILKAWASATPQSPRVAEAVWFQSRQEDVQSFEAKHLKWAADRSALLEYAMTGRFSLDPSDLSGSVASVLMVGLPLVQQLPQSLLQIVPLEEIGRVLDADPSQSFMAAVKHWLSSRLSIIADSLDSNSLQVNLWHRRVEDCIADLADLKAASISWGDLVDFFHPGGFHRLAHRIGRDATHFAVSLKWTRHVFGTCVFDYRCSERKSLFKAGREAIGKYYQSLGDALRSRLRCPPAVSPLQLGNVPLYKTHEHAWAKVWQQMSPGPLSVESIRMGQFNPFSPKGCEALYLRWHYVHK